MPHSGYEHDVFISYARRGETRDWVGDHFRPALEHCLGLELNEKPNIFFDQDLSVDVDWPRQLGMTLARSRVLVILWTKNYLDSEWCRLELCHMLKREEFASCRTESRPNGIIAIPVIHDGETIPSTLQAFQRLEIQKCFNPRMRRNSRRAEQLFDSITKNARAIATLIENAPDWNDKWPGLAVDEFVALFQRHNPPTQRLPPRFTVQ